MNEKKRNVKAKKARTKKEGSNASKVTHTKIDTNNGDELETTFDTRDAEPRTATHRPRQSVIKSDSEIVAKRQAVIKVEEFSTIFTSLAPKAILEAMVFKSIHAIYNF